MIDRSAVRGVVLAGGDSARFADGDKALAEFDGRPLLAHVVDALADATGGRPLLAVSSTAEGERLRAALPEETRVEPVRDADTHAGPVAGLFAAASAADRDWLAVCGCDMPLVSPAGIDALRREADPDVTAVAPTVDGHDQPLHALYRRDAVIAAREAVPPAGGPMALLDTPDAVQRVPATDVDAPLAAAVTNVNTRDDLARVRDEVQNSAE